MRPIRLLLVDDHPLVLQGIRVHLDGCPDLMVVGAAQTATDALDLLTLDPDVAVVDLGLPDTPGLELIRIMRATRPSLGVVVLTMHDDESYVLRALGLGARGYVLKEQPPDALADAVRAVHAGHSYLSPQVSRYLVDRVAAPHRQAATILTDREAQVLTRIAEGETTREIADHLYLSPRTVETYRDRLMRKLDLHSIADLTRYAVTEGLTHVTVHVAEED